jgi:hypothetical protein
MVLNRLGSSNVSSGSLGEVPWQQLRTFPQYRRDLLSCTSELRSAPKPFVQFRICVRLNALTASKGIVLQGFNMVYLALAQLTLTERHCRERVHIG